MKEKVLNNKKNGMPMLLLFTALYLAAIALVIVSGIQLDAGRIGFVPLMILGILWLLVGWVPFCGLKVLKPQEALVLTLFGKYIGSLKEDGFYFVNPFCVAVNPAAKTKLNQSGDVDAGSGSALLNAALSKNAEAAAEMPSKKISLKAMTLSNSRQKINDCLGNPVEIGIAVIWKVTDTAKAVFHVDNFKEYLSLQCDSAVRNIVRIYPYDVAPAWTRPATAWRTRAACAARASSWPSASATRSSRRWRTPASRSSRPASPIWPTPPRSRRSCCSASRPAPSSTRAR